MSAALLVLFALLPLQWIAAPAAPFGLDSLHELAILGFTAYLLLRLRARTYAPALKTGAAFVVANLYMIGAIAASQLYLGLSLVPVARQLLYLVGAVAIAGYFCRALRVTDTAVIAAARLTSVVLCVSLLIGLGLAMAVNGVNPVAVLGRTVAAADPEIFQKEIFKSAFVGFGRAEGEVAGNLRHEIFGALLLSMLISSWAMRVGANPTRWQRRLHRLAIVLGTVLLLLSMSRAVVLAAIMWPLLAALRTLRRGEMSGRQLAIVAASVVALGGVAVSGFGAVIYNRFFIDTASYEGRTGHYRDAFDAVSDHWVTGGYDTVGVSTHNLVFDTLLRNGVFAAIPALFLVCIVAATLWWLAARLDRLPPSMVPVAAALCLPLVRMVTIGGGQISPVGWLALGFVLGVLAARRAVPSPAFALRPEGERAGV
ncbi:O-antigen ligase family protein [Blastococcus deserti]|uniref:O-antigen ligase family protein n=1 Tax=Blastococcus deserti TaxID=2259033 RepID=A0ABW4X8U7_9ACTN